MAATNIIIIKECLRYCLKILDVSNPIFPRKKDTMGSWKTTPINNVSVVNVEM